MEKFYVTTAIDYVNGAPHLGHALEKIQADVIARYQRMFGEKDVYFLTGTDEHGIKIVQSAEEAGRKVEDFVDLNVEKFKKLCADLNISYSDFIRTSDKKRHWPVARSIWKKMEEEGDIYKSKYKGFYCVGCEAFITEKDLINGKCPYHESLEPELIEEENYFFKLSKYAAEIRKKIETDELLILPEARKNEVLEILKDVKDISCSRPAEKVCNWGVPVPGDESQIMYVWIEALTNYLQPKDFWPADTHVIGKDILRFHAVVWPAMLLSVGLELPKKIFAHGFVLSGGKRMSKSSGNVIDPFELIEEYGADALRYYLLREITPTEDGDLTKEKFKKVYNANLANGLGNLVSRVMKMAEQFDGFAIEEPSWIGIEAYLDKMELNKAMDYIWERISQSDLYIQEEQPFKIIKEDKEKARAILWNLISALNQIAFLLGPFMPDTSEKILNVIKDNKMPESLFPRKD
ncbi:MAG: methionine--tRNA ligase [Candidatus Tagabacteria bacterium CG10_big_fil_rev_8_21_14_0_10_40_13]|uniref:Methionine--tRNA ligase n=3 Tax=Candidatus Tagaibacteriota TaxID=1817918 RepID=A0A2M8L867_9BACT|nr:MAG: methionine--tRNA ligase [Candidatus Tagabacteria bacterium CG10_big_fil_rev_8_21_14_0_10_40_13]